MTRLARRVSLIAALSLFTSATTASAECAWVLWGLATGQKLAKGADGKVLPTDKYNWVSSPDPSMEQAFPTYAECEKSRQRQTPEKPSIAVKEFRVANQVGTINEVVLYEVVFRCLPDTVDPRGPKGK